MNRLKHIYDTIVNENNLQTFSLPELNNYAETILNSQVEKDKYCENTYVKPRLKRTPDKMKFISDLVDTFNQVVTEHYYQQYQNWITGDYYFLDSKGNFILSQTDEGNEITDLEIWKHNLQNTISRVEQDNLFEFLDEVKYYNYLLDEKECLLTNEIKGERLKPQYLASCFIVHGHNNEVKQTVARFLETLKIEAIILSEQGGIQSILDKIENCSNVDFSIILLTPDDYGNVIAQMDKPNKRARQNVIFEFGYFVAKLGKSKVIALKLDDVELPSDYGGIIYINFDDADGWKLKLGKEIMKIGIEIDLKNLIK
ncbi:MAG: nucleotide-binding protein [Saprospiraceae bacterium]|jgi:predicted nucleotide-binding protein|nr:nucleotide-binding protein [Saprospiraceae bacterium]